MLAPKQNQNHQDTPRECVYSVYIYHRKKQTKCLPKWEKLSTTHNAKRAVKYARLLHNHEKYERIEVKKQSFDTKEKRFIGKTTHTYQKSALSWKNILKLIGNHTNK